MASDAKRTTQSKNSAVKTIRLFYVPLFRSFTTRLARRWIRAAAIGGFVMAQIAAPFPNSTVAFAGKADEAKAAMTKSEKKVDAAQSNSSILTIDPPTASQFKFSDPNPKETYHLINNSDTVVSWYAKTLAGMVNVNPSLGILSAHESVALSLSLLDVDDLGTQAAAGVGKIEDTVTISFASTGENGITSSNQNAEPIMVAAESGLTPEENDSATAGTDRYGMMVSGGSAHCGSGFLSSPNPVNIGAGLPPPYEPSDAVWHPGLQKLLIVSDGGRVSMMNADGGEITTWNKSGDMEGIAYADESSDIIYVGIEHPDSIKEFNITTGQFGRTFDLTPWMQSADNNQGLEALVFIPDDSDPEGGVFYAGLQSDGRIYKFRLPIHNAPSTAVTFLEVVNVVPGRGDIAGLTYDRDNHVLYALWDSANQVRAINLDGTCLIPAGDGSCASEWDVGGNDREGIAIKDYGPSQLFIAEDLGTDHQVWQHAFDGCRVETSYTLDIGIIGNGSVTRDPNLEAYEAGSTVTLTAVPSAGHVFKNWSGDTSGNQNPVSIVMDGDKTVTAEFVPTYTLNVTVQGSGLVAVSPNLPVYPEGTRVTLTAMPHQSSVFRGWMGDILPDQAAANPITIVMNQNKSVSARFGRRILLSEAHKFNH